MNYYLLDHRNPNRDNFYSTRRNPVLAITVHITAGLEDLDLEGIDHSAENTARYAATTNRKVSWHSGSDSDTHLYLLPSTYTAWHNRGYNSCTYGHEISKRSPDWRGMDPLWVRATLHQTALALRPIAIEYDIPLRLASLRELDTAINRGGPPVGFIGHHTLDPGRRSDPGHVRFVGDTFPWHQLFQAITTIHSTPPPYPITPEEEEVSVLTEYRWPDGSAIKVHPDGGIENLGSPYYGSVPGLKAEYRQAWSGKARGVLPVDSNNPTAGYTVIDAGNGNKYTFDEGVLHSGMLA